MTKPETASDSLLAEQIAHYRAIATETKIMSSPKKTLGN